MALVVLIFVLPVFYSFVVNSIRVDVKERELKEIADYVANTIENLYLMANATSGHVLLKKMLDLPVSVEGSFYVVEIARDGDRASSVKAYIEDDLAVQASAWLIGGLKLKNGVSVESGNHTIFAWCERCLEAVYVWLSCEAT
jgi:hypothetical protein